MFKKHLSKLLALALASTLAGCAGSEMTRHSQGFIAPRDFNQQTDMITEADAELINFPSQIPGAGRIDKYIIPQAKKVIVHVRQRHLTDDDSPQDVVGIQDCQEDIYTILYYLIDRGLGEIYVEAIVPETVKASRKKAWEFEQKKRQIETNMQICERNSDYWQRQMVDYAKSLAAKTMTEDETYKISLINSLDESRVRVTELKKEKEKQEREELLRGAAFWLAMEGKIELKAAESLATFTAARAMMKSHRKDLEAFLAVMENREDMLLEMVSTSPKPLVVCVFGGRHALGGTYSCGRHYSFKGKGSIIDNIAVWNHDHPDEKYSLIEITPKGYF
jgi:hypothetical protein